MNTEHMDNFPTLTYTLRARDPGGLTAFYRDALGLEVLDTSSQGATLGVAGRAMLHLHGGAAAPQPPGAPGLFHAAYLLPSRAELGRFLAHAERTGLRLGAGDHLVSEALYLADPEGNGIEVYADRPRAQWTWRGDQVQMDTLPVDLPGLLALAPEDESEPYRMPPGTVLGHLHLQVSEVARARDFYVQALGMRQVSTFPGAVFLAWGDYHHHLGINAWRVRPGACRQLGTAGLAGWAVRREGGGAGEAQDPEGIPVRWA